MKPEYEFEHAFIELFREVRLIGRHIPGEREPLEPHERLQLLNMAARTFRDATGRQLTTIGLEIEIEDPHF